MAKNEIRSEEKYYTCPVCGLAYEDEEWAKKCEAWCSEHDGSCNLDIIQHAVNNESESCC